MIIPYTLLLFCLLLPLTLSSCDIVIAGGTLAALGAAIQSPLSRSVCLVEPTDRLGGQWGEEGVWHIDFNWLYQKGYPDNTTAYNHANLHPFFSKVATQCSTGDCWVSRNCFLYSCIEPIIAEYVTPLVASGALTIFWNSTITGVSVVGGSIRQLSVVTRSQTLREDCRPADVRIRDWYDPIASEYYTKVVSSIRVDGLVIEASQYSDVLVLSKGSFSQGTPRSDVCGQSIVFCLHQEYSSQSQLLLEKQHPALAEDDFSLGSYTADQVWRYRRLLGKGNTPRPGEVSLQNWDGPGNDYRGGYLFLPVADLNLQSWAGGLNYTTLHQAQARSMRFHSWFKDQSNLPLKATGKYFKTCNGLAKLPYVRDGRRSVGYNGFTLKGQDVTGLFVPDQKVTSTVFGDRLSLGFYNMDLHSITGCAYDPYGQKIPLPFFLPARAFTNSKIKNLITAGRAMAQEFNASMATRTHSTEFSSGVASILMATYMSGLKLSSTWQLMECPQCIEQLQDIIRRVMPLEWTIAGKLYPSRGGHPHEI